MVLLVAISWTVAVYKTNVGKAQPDRRSQFSTRKHFHWLSLGEKRFLVCTHWRISVTFQLKLSKYTLVQNCPIIIRNVLYEYLLSNYPIIFSSQWFMSTICEGCQHVYGFDESLVFPQTPFCHQSFPILSSALTSPSSLSCNHHNPIADTMLARLGNNCDNRRSVNIYYLSFIWSWRWRGDAGCRRCRHWQVKRHRQSWTTALLGPSCE